MRKTVVASVGVAGLVVGVILLQGLDSPHRRPQSTCPVTGQAVDPRTSPHVDWQGQRIYFADRAAADRFRADPEVVFTKLEGDGVELENVEETCPVSGEKLLRAGTPELRYKGRTIRFCCDSCPGKFELDPAKYLARMPGEQVASR